jgi:hypothetical protein
LRSNMVVLCKQSFEDVSDLASVEEVHMCREWQWLGLEFPQKSLHNPGTRATTISLDCGQFCNSARGLLLTLRAIVPILRIELITELLPDLS